MVPGAPVAENVWNVYKGVAQLGADGGHINIFFRLFYNSAPAPKLIESICTKAYDESTNQLCQGKGDKGATTQGGEIKIGSGDDYLMIGFDPKSA